MIRLVESDEENLTKLMVCGYEDYIKKNGSFEERIIKYITDPDLLKFGETNNKSFVERLEIKTKDFKRFHEENSFSIKGILSKSNNISGYLYKFRLMLPQLNEIPDSIRRSELLEIFSNQYTANIHMEKRKGFFHYSLNSTFLIKDNEKEYYDHIEKCHKNAINELNLEEIRIPENRSDFLLYIRDIVNKTNTPLEKINHELRAKLEDLKLKDMLEININNNDDIYFSNTKKRRL